MVYKVTTNLTFAPQIIFMRYRVFSNSFGTHTIKTKLDYHQNKCFEYIICDISYFYSHMKQNNILLMLLMHLPYLA